MLMENGSAVGLDEVEKSQCINTKEIQVGCRQKTERGLNRDKEENMKAVDKAKNLNV